MMFSQLKKGFSLVCLIIIVLNVASCSSIGEKGHKLFQKLGASQTNITFKNELEYRDKFNIYRYRNFYNGGGVALGDINNDGLLDLYFTANMGDNELYLNEGNFKFRNITKRAGVAGQKAWSTGVSMVDINGDGLLDIYVCNSGIVEGDDKRNELFINNGDSTFTERAAEYGIDDPGLSIHGTFFDYDRDGDLDLYLVNNSYRAIGSFDLQKNVRGQRDVAGGDKLYRNELISDPSGEPMGSTTSGESTRESPFSQSDTFGRREGKGDGPSPDTAKVEGGAEDDLKDDTAGIPKFTDASKEAGIYGSEIGFGLGVSVADLNGDGWPDMYVSNDFFERDYLYINRQNGTFSEVLEERIKSISAASMGSDIGDLNGDGFQEIFVTDMLPKPDSRIKTVTTFDSWERYQSYLSNDYYHQFTRNTLQLNNGDGTFSEIGRYAGVEATDWSWGALIADLDMDGRRDIFVANGIYQDLTNLDYLQKVSQEETVKEIVSDSGVDFRSLIDLIPSTPIANYAFHNKGNLQFSDSAAAWGLDEPGFSNGSAYGDLDNDGDPDLVVNNVNSPPWIFKNRVEQKYPNRNWLQISFEGLQPNTQAIGTSVVAWEGDRSWYAEQMPVRGFQSTVDDRLYLGLGEVKKLDSLQVMWPDGAETMIKDLQTNQQLVLKQSDVQKSPLIRREQKGGLTLRVVKAEHTKPLLKDITKQTGLNWRHRENSYNDFSRQPLLFHMRSTEGPPLCKADADGNGLVDFYAGGASGQAGVLFMQQKWGAFNQIVSSSLEADKVSEDTDCAWFDADGDGDQDLYVASGGSELPSSSSALIDRLYRNDGQGNLSPAERIIPAGKFEPTSSVEPADFDQDGDVDLFVGIRLKPFSYGIPVSGYLLENDGKGNFSDVTDTRAPALNNLGMITDAQWSDSDQDGDPDLWVTGEWMPVTLFKNNSGNFTNETSAAGLDSTQGWWNSIALGDLDGDGDQDFVAGNHGLNSRFKASPGKPLTLWVNDFDKNGTVEQVITSFNGDKSYPVSLKHHLAEEIPALDKKYPDYESYKEQTISDIFTDQQLEGTLQYEVYHLESVAGWNNGDGTYTIKPLPMRSQLSPMYALQAFDLNEDGKTEILTGGNLYNVKPQVGRYDASYGSVVRMQGDSLISLPARLSGFQVSGQVRQIISLPTAQGTIFIVAKNDDEMQAFRLAGGG